MGGMLVARFGWRSFFVALGLLSLIWLGPWIKYMPERSSASSVGVAGAPSLWEFLRLQSAWGTCIGLLCFNYVNYFLITWLPYYLVRERHFSLRSMAKIGGAAYLLGACCGMASGWLSDRWVARGGTPTRVRKTFAAGGLFCCGIFVGLAAVNGNVFCVAMLLLALIFFGVGSSNIWAITQILAGPQAAGRWTGFQNFIGNFAGMIGPAVTGVVLDRTGHLGWAFAITAAVALIGTTAWLFLVGPVVPVTWHKKIQADAVAI
jgi:predicted MFS family arabinose efflux permease